VSHIYWHVVSYTNSFVLLRDVVKSGQVEIYI
jgi:hypothetical protein